LIRVSEGWDVTRMEGRMIGYDKHPRASRSPY
jgi:hypothetical protein